MNISIGLEDQKHFINKYQEPCDAPKKLNHAEKWVLPTGRINFAQNWKRLLKNSPLTRAFALLLQVQHTASQKLLFVFLQAAFSFLFSFPFLFSKAAFSLIYMPWKVLCVPLGGEILRAVITTTETENLK